MYEDSGRVIVGELVWSFIAAIIGGIFGSAALVMNSADKIAFPGLLVGTFTFMILFVVKVFVWWIHQGDKHQAVLITREDKRIERARTQMKLHQKQFEAHSIEEQVKQTQSKREPIQINLNAAPVAQQPTNITPPPTTPPYYTPQEGQP